MIKANIPLAIQVVIDDVGWWSGEDSSSAGGPFRTGINRNHCLKDYEAIIELATRLKIRPQIAMVLCEWDRENILKELPNSTWMGTKWDNSHWVGSWLDEATNLLNQNSQYVEIAFHAIGHEYWENGIFSRAEWLDSEGNMRPKTEIVAHIEYYKKLMEQNNLGSFPSSFVPAAFLHSFSKDGEGLAKILRRYGIKYISTPYSRMFKSCGTEGDFFGIDNGIITVDRGNDICKWNDIAPYPEGKLTGPVCGMHWPNLLHTNADRNNEVVERWVSYLTKYTQMSDRILAANSSEAFSQVVYNWGVAITNDENSICLDFSEFSTITAIGLLDSFYIKVEGDEILDITSDELEILMLESNAESKQTIIKARRKGDSLKAKIKLALFSDNEPLCLGDIAPI